MTDAALSSSLCDRCSLQVRLDRAHAAKLWPALVDSRTVFTESDVMDPRGRWLSSSRVVASYASWLRRPGRGRRESSRVGWRGVRDPPLARVTSQQKFNREVSISSEKLRNDVCHRCRTRFSSFFVLRLRTVRHLYPPSMRDDLWLEYPIPPLPDFTCPHQVSKA